MTFSCYGALEIVYVITHLYDAATTSRAFNDSLSLGAHGSQLHWRSSSSSYIRWIASRAPAQQRRRVYENKSIARSSATPTHVVSSIHRLPWSPWQHDIYLTQTRYADTQSDRRPASPCWGELDNRPQRANRRESAPAGSEGRLLRRNPVTSIMAQTDVIRHNQLIKPVSHGLKSRSLAAPSPWSATKT